MTVAAPPRPGLVPCPQPACPKACHGEVNLTAHLIGDHAIEPNEAQRQAIAATRARSAPKEAPVADRKCSKCGKPGHYARSCGQTTRKAARAAKGKPRKLVAPAKPPAMGPAKAAALGFIAELKNHRAEVDTMIAQLEKAAAILW